MADDSVSSYDIQPFEWPGRDECLRIVARAIQSHPPSINNRAIENYFDAGVVIHLRRDGIDGEAFATFRPDLPSPLVHLYISFSDVGYVFDGALFPHDPALMFAVGCIGIYNADRTTARIPLSALAGASDLAAAILVVRGGTASDTPSPDNDTLPVNIRWPRTPCYIHFSPIIGTPHVGFSLEELGVAIRRRLALYTSIQRSGSLGPSAEHLNSTCPCIDSRYASLDLLVVYLLSCVMVNNLDLLIGNEISLFRWRMRYQADTPGKRADILERNHLMGEYQTYAAREPHPHFITWIGHRYESALREINKCILKMGDDDVTRVPEPFIQAMIQTKAAVCQWLVEQDR